MLCLSFCGGDYTHRPTIGCLPEAFQIFANRALLITGGTGTFGNAVLRRFFVVDMAKAASPPACESCLMEALLTDSVGAENATRSFYPCRVMSGILWSCFPSSSVGRRTRP